MFSGIVEEYAEVVNVVKDRDNLHLTLKCSFANELKVDQSVSHNGVCLTVVCLGDGTYTVTAMKENVEDANGSWYYTFKYHWDAEMARKGYMAVDKGSVTVNGVSLTVCNPTEDSFQVAIIPYTYEHTNFHTIHEGTVVNIEFDIIGKYISRLLQLSKE